jgi:transcriptional regulator with XRE-family HTH domain
MNHAERREKLKAFLRARRAAMLPETLGLALGASSRRRTPGLRREEVAVAAGVSVTWYTCLEQGRDVRPSREALKRIGRALGLTQSDQSYLFMLAGEEPPPPSPTRAFSVDPHLRSLMDACQVPVLVWGHNAETVAYNQMADAIFDFDDYRGPFATNHAWRLFMDPKRRALYEDFDDAAARMVAFLRTRAASPSPDPGLDRLVEALRAKSKDFERLWNDTDTIPLGRLELRLRHPRLGRLRLSRVALSLASEPDITIVMLSGTDAKTASVLSRLANRTRRTRRHHLDVG